MRTFLRSLLYLSLVVWLGAEAFFPIVAAKIFGALQPDTHLAGTIVGRLLGILHGMGLVAAMVTLAALALSAAKGIYRARGVLAPAGLVIAMMALTLYSQFSITPVMEQDRIAAGGAVDLADPASPARMDFKRLHDRSEHTEGLIMLLGLGLVVLVAKEESARS